MTSETNPAPDSLSKPELLTAFVSADSRERRRLIQLIRPIVEAEDMAQLAPCLRDGSPKIAARITSLLARFELEELFEKQLDGLKEGKKKILRSHFKKITTKVAKKSDAAEN